MTRHRAEDEGRRRGQVSGPGASTSSPRPRSGAPGILPDELPPTEVSTKPPPGGPPLSAEPAALLAHQLAVFNHRLEELLSRERIAGRPEDRKETWVLLSALALVVVFCFVAFFMNQAELREMHSGLQDEIDRAGRSSASSLERTLGAYRLDRLGDNQAGLERLLREKDQRDARRLTELLEELQRRGQEGDRLQNGLRQLGDQVAGLRRVAEEIRELHARTTPALAGVVGDLSQAALEGRETQAGWAARSPDGASANMPPVPAARPPSLEIKERTSLDGTGTTP